MIYELARCPTRLENVYFANNEQASIAVFSAVFCFTYAERNLIIDQGKLLRGSVLIQFATLSGHRLLRILTHPPPPYWPAVACLNKCSIRCFCFT